MACRKRSSRPGPDCDRSAALLGDHSARDYARKLQYFNAFAEPELRRAITGLALHPGMRALDAGCGTGEALGWLDAAVAPGGVVFGIDLSAAHVAAARVTAGHARVAQADVSKPPLRERSLDLVWSVNTLNHLRDPVAGVRGLARLLRPGGRIAVGQSALLPEMFFAWNSRLERLTTEAVRRYYRDRYGLSERDLAGTRALVGWLRSASLREVSACTSTIERISPLGPRDEAYLREAIFRGTWGERLRPYLSRRDYAELARYCDPADPEFALRRPDFHFLQTFTLVTGAAAE